MTPSNIVEVLFIHNGSNFYKTDPTTGSQAQLNKSDGNHDDVPTKDGDGTSNVGSANLQIQFDDTGAKKIHIYNNTGSDITNAAYMIFGLP